MERVEKEAAVVTGASSGIGLAISRKLCALGYEVYGIGRDFGKTELEYTDAYHSPEDGENGNRQDSGKEEPEYTDAYHSPEDGENGNRQDSGKEERESLAGFHPVVCDVLETEKLCSLVKQIAAQNKVCILVNNAGVGYYGLHEELSPKKIREMVRTNLEAPMILTQQLLRHLKKNAGYVINIASVTANESNPHGCTYGATKAGLASFSRSLFDEARKYGVKAVTVFPDMTKTNLYRNADFEEGDEIESYLQPDEVAGAVEFILSQREGILVSEITLKPQIHRIRKKQQYRSSDKSCESR